MKKILLIAFAFVSTLLNAQDGDFTALKTNDSIKIDGIADDSVWAKQEWNDINYVWIPYHDTTLKPDDFTGRYKAAWDSAFLYLLVEVVDDSLYDGHVGATDNYWNDDCVEVFLDEDKSGGEHNSSMANEFNAFAYHVSTYYDVVDNDSPSTTATFNDNISARMVKHDSLYTWELAIKVYDDTYQIGGSNIPVKLEANKVMGFSLAYCDNDSVGERQNFIGSRDQTEANANMSWLNASVFGSLTLIDPQTPDTTQNPSNISDNIKTKDAFIVYPTICKNDLTIKSCGLNLTSLVTINVYDSKGALCFSKRMIFNKEESATISTQQLPLGTYNLIIQGNKEILNTRFIKIN